ncbi:MAG: hypothetical protein ACKOQ6_03055 [Bacteroidota bacterium]
MKPFLFFFTFVASFATAAAPDLKDNSYDRPKTYFEKDSLDPRSLLNLGKVELVSTKFGSSEMESNLNFEKFPSDSVREIWMIYTDYSGRPGFDQEKLNRDRINKLYAKLPWLKKYPNIRWQDMVYKNLQNRDAASGCFHGFVLVYKQTTAEPTLGPVLKRHRDWDSVIVVVDVTTSMLPWLQEVYFWLYDNMHNTQIDRFVYYNDGDGRADDTKLIGSTGGVHSDTSKDYHTYITGIRKNLIMGFGNMDIPENTLEALMEAQRYASKGSVIVLLADNISTPRDTALIDSLKFPIKVVACGAVRSDINPSLVNIAYRTGGSVHTGLTDIINFKEVRRSPDSRMPIVVNKKKYFPVGRQMKCSDCVSIKN